MAADSEPQDSPDELLAWKNWKYDHPEFKRDSLSIVPFEGKILIVGGYVSDPNLDPRPPALNPLNTKKDFLRDMFSFTNLCFRTKETFINIPKISRNLFPVGVNLILIDPETQKFKIIKFVGDYAERDCWGKLTVTFWKESKFVVTGGVSFLGDKKSTLVSVFTFKDLDSESPSTCWEKTKAPTREFRPGDSGHIHKDKMYVVGAEIDQKILCLDLVIWTWEFFSKGIQLKDSGVSQVFSAFHENKAYLIYWGAKDNKEWTIQEMDLNTMTSQLFALPDLKIHSISVKVCPQVVNKKIYIYTNQSPLIKNMRSKHQIFALNLKTKNWIEIKTTKPSPVDRKHVHLAICKDQLVLYGGWTMVPMFGDIWSLPLSSTNLTNSQKTMRKLLEEAPYSDISFEVESEIIKAHKWWLWKKSKYFANMFASGMSEAQASSIKITDMKAETFQALLEFLYSEYVELDNTLALELLQQADKYSINELSKQCEAYLAKNLTSDNYVAVVEIAEILDMVSLREAVIDFIAKNIKELRQRKDFEKISDSVLRDSIVKFIVK